MDGQMDGMHINISYIKYDITYNIYLYTYHIYHVYIYTHAYDGDLQSNAFWLGKKRSSMIVPCLQGLNKSTLL